MNCYSPRGQAQRPHYHYDDEENVKTERYATEGKIRVLFLEKKHYTE